MVCSKAGSLINISSVFTSEFHRSLFVAENTKAKAKEYSVIQKVLILFRVSSVNISLEYLLIESFE